MEKIALLEVLDRDGRVRQSFPIHAWPLQVGRALDCDVVLDDPYVAPHHFTLDGEERGVAVKVGDTVNGLRCGRELLPAGHRSVRSAGEEWLVGQTRLRLRHFDEPLAAELVLPRASTWHWPGLALVLFGLGLWTAWGEYLGTDPGGFLTRAVPALIGVFAMVAGWSFLWALGSKLFQHRLDYWTHVRIAAAGMLASGMLAAVLGVLAFMTSWVFLSRIRGAAEAVVLGVAVYAHLSMVLPQRRQALAWGVGAAVLAGITVAAAFQYQRSGRFSDELYLSVLPPPALRMVPSEAPAEFLARAGALKQDLDQAARESGSDVATDEDIELTE